jgi:hypothetical protein
MFIGGKFYTKYDKLLGISMTSKHSVIRHQFTIDDDEDEGIGCDMIIGQDLAVQCSGNEH